MLLHERLTGSRRPRSTHFLRSALVAEPVIDRLDPSARDALDPAVRAGVVVIRDGHVAFTHPLLASSLVGMTEPVRVRSCMATLPSERPARRSAPATSPWPPTVPTRRWPTS